MLHPSFLSCTADVGCRAAEKKEEERKGGGWTSKEIYWSMKFNLYVMGEKEEGREAGWTTRKTEQREEKWMEKE